MTEWIDEFGCVGLLIDYAMILTFFCSALMIFIYLWSIGRLDMDETAKYEMMKEEP